MAVEMSRKKFEGILKWLRGKLPESIVVYNVAVLVDEGKLPFLVWVDNETEPSVIVMRADKNCKVPYYSRQLFVYSPDPVNDTKIEDVLRSPDVVNISEDTVLYSTQRRLRDVVVSILTSLGMKYSGIIAESYTYVLDKGYPILKCTLPEKYKIGKVTEELADIMNSKWKFSSTNASGRIKDALSWGHPSICIFDNNNIPISWAYQKFYGFVGNLHTEDGFRGQGIGKFVLSEITKLILQKCDHAYTAIEKENPVSIALHEKIGYQRCPENMEFDWLGFSPDLS